MITAVVTFKVPKEMTRDKALELFKSRAPIFQNMPGLISKQFLFDADRNVAGGVYLWESRAVADACYQGPWKDGIRKLALSEPEIAWFDSPVVINNETRQVKTAA
jgi:heme-degrading monooxygenase HmoA